MAPAPDVRCLVLLVDDEPRGARVLAQMLREDGYDVETAFDGAAAIARLSREPVPDVLLTDYRMAHADGITVAKFARTQRAAMPVVFVTAYPELAVKKSSDLDPAPIVLPKPAVYADVTRAIAHVRGTLATTPRR